MSALASLVMGLRLCTPLTLRVSTARALHAAVLGAIQQDDPAASRWLHDSDGAAASTERPWTVSPIAGATRQHGHTLLEPDADHWARITALDENTVALIYRVLAPLRCWDAAERSQAITLDGVEIALSAAPSGSPALPVRETSYTELWHSTAPASVISVHWLTTTLFRQRRELTAAPGPVLVLGSWLRRWNAFAPRTLRMDSYALTEFVSRHVVVRDESLRFRREQLGRFEVRGFTGVQSWELRSGAEDLARQVAVLARYALYCGTGAKTALGLGQTITSLDATLPIDVPAGW
ncbi:MAG: CRISPR system precrRNA processing endoribonuclease RAMP protein Cas6 [Chloroflexota bacterium]